MAGDIGRTNEQLVEMDFLKWSLKQEGKKKEAARVDLISESATRNKEGYINVHPSKEARG